MAEKTIAHLLDDPTPDRTSLYGAGGNSRIVQDGLRLAYAVLSGHITEDSVRYSDQDTGAWRFALWRLIGIDEGHSGGSWSGVRSSCINVLGGYNAYGGDPVMTQEDARAVLRNHFATDLEFVNLPDVPSQGTLEVMEQQYRAQQNTEREEERVVAQQLKLDAKARGDLVYDVYHIDNAATIGGGDLRDKHLIATFRSNEFDGMHEFIVDYLNRVYPDGWFRDKKATGIHGSLYRLGGGWKEHPIEVDDRIRSDGEVISYGITTPAE